MSVHQLLKRLEELGVELTLAGEGIRYKSRGQQLPPELLTEMKQHRGELVSILTHRSQLAWPPPRRDAHDGIRTGPLTAAQRTVWATNFFLDDGTYNLAGAVRLRGVLDTTAFAAALGDVHHRHPSLRTVFPMEHGEPRQHILTTVPTRLEMHEVAAAPGAAALDDCLRECASRADEQLAVDDAPPVRTRLYRLSEEDHVFFVVLHHVIADGPSVPVLIDDLARCYNARLDGHAAAPPPSHVDMVDYAHWERDRQDPVVTVVVGQDQVPRAEASGPT